MPHVALLGVEYSDSPSLEGDLRNVSWERAGEVGAAGRYSEAGGGYQDLNWNLGFQAQDCDARSRKPTLLKNRPKPLPRHGFGPAGRQPMACPTRQVRRFHQLERAIPGRGAPTRGRVLPSPCLA